MYKNHKNGGNGTDRKPQETEMAKNSSLPSLLLAFMKLINAKATHALPQMQERW